MAKAQTINGVPLPTWADEASVQSYLTTGVGLAVAFITLLHPGFVEPTWVQGVIPAVAFVVAGVAQLVNIVMKQLIKKAAIESGFPVDE